MIVHYARENRTCSGPSSSPEIVLMKLGEHLGECHSIDTPCLVWHFPNGCVFKRNIMVYYNPYITGQYNPLYTLNNQGPFFNCSEINPKDGHTRTWKQFGRVNQPKIEWKWTFTYYIPIYWFLASIYLAVVVPVAASLPHFFLGRTSSGSKEAWRPCQGNKNQQQEPGWKWFCCCWFADWLIIMLHQSLDLIRYKLYHRCL